MRAGLISPEEAKESRFRNIITRSVGFEPSVEPDLAGIAIQAGDCFVLCSDGLSNYLTLDELGQVLTGHFYRDVAKVFVDLANERGGDDNVTCLVVYAGNDTGTAGPCKVPRLVAAFLDALADDGLGQLRDHLPDHLLDDSSRESLAIAAYSGPLAPIAASF